jgi:hypothetical protein
MHSFKLLATPSPLRIFVTGATAALIAYAVPCLAQTNINGPQGSSGSTNQNEIKIDARPPANQPLPLPATNHYLEFGSKIISGLGLLSAISALALTRFVVLPRIKDAKSRLKRLEASDSSKTYFTGELAELNSRLAQHMQKSERELSIIEIASRKELTALQTNLYNLESQLQLLKNPASGPEASSVTTSNFTTEQLLPPPVPPTPTPESKPEPTPEPTPESQVSYPDELTAIYLAAVLSNDRSRIRNITTAELNITQASEDALIRGTLNLETQLENVVGGGSYILISHGDKYWACPTVQTLTSFTSYKPQKGIFNYEDASTVSTAELKRAAEVRLIDDGIWEVVSKGIVLVPA